MTRNRSRAISYCIVFWLILYQSIAFAIDVNWQSIAHQAPDSLPIVFSLDATEKTDLSTTPGPIIQYYQKKQTDTFVCNEMNAFLKSQAVAREGLEVIGGQLDYPRFAPVDIKGKTDIWSNTMNDNRTWHWNHQQLYAVRQLMATAEQSQSPENRNQVIAFIESFVQDWAKANFGKDFPSKFSWHDHATAYRLRNLLFLFEFLRQDESSDAEFLTELLRLIHAHMLVLSDSEFYSRRTNHGLDQSFILYWATKLHPLMQDSDWIGPLASERMADEINFMFTPEGVHVENSPGYHNGVLTSLGFIRQLYSAYGDSAAADPLSVTLDKAWTYLAYIIKPNGQLPLIGDTYTTNLRADSLKTNGYPGQSWYVYSATAGAAGQCPPWVDWVATTAGYAIFRDRWPDQAEFDQTFYLVFKDGFLSQYHRHDDDLSFVLSAYGEDWLIDSGGYNYQENEPMRIYMRSARAHNTVIPQGNVKAFRYLGQTPPGTGIIDYGLGINRSQVTGRSMMYPEMVMQRQLVYEKPNVVILKDQVIMNDAKATPPGLDIVFHFPQDKTIKIKGNRIEVVSADGATTLSIQPQASVQGIKLETGVREPSVQGWYSPTFEVLIPSQAITISYQPTAASIPIITQLIFEH